VRQVRPEYLYFSPTRLSLVGLAGAVAAGGLFGFAVVKAWPEGGIFPQRPAAAVAAAVEPERFYPVPEPAPAQVTERPTSAVAAVEATIPAPSTMLVEQSSPPAKRVHPVARAASSSHHRQARTVAYRRNGYYTTPSAMW
jgi:hypothetical protein